MVCQRLSPFSSLSFELGRAILVVKDLRERAGARPHPPKPPGHLAKGQAHQRSLFLNFSPFPCHRLPASLAPPQTHRSQDRLGEPRARPRPRTSVAAHSHSWCARPGAHALPESQATVGLLPRKKLWPHFLIVHTDPGGVGAQPRSVQTGPLLGAAGEPGIKQVGGFVRRRRQDNLVSLLANFAND